MAISRKELEQWYDEEFCLAAVRDDGYALQYVRNQTEKICLAAVRVEYDALQYVERRFWTLFADMISD